MVEAFLEQEFTTKLSSLEKRRLIEVLQNEPVVAKWLSLPDSFVIRLASSTSPALLTSSDSLKLREYQKELLQYCISTNSIVCLPTGSGKTAISIELAKSFVSQRRPGTFTIFLAPTVPLVEQQAEAFTKYGGLRTLAVCGGKNDRFTWNDVLLGVHVLAMTPGTLLNWFSRDRDSEYAHMKRVSLIVFDECHHAIRGSHPYTEIAKWISENLQYDPPRIVGLSASPSGGLTLGQHLSSLFDIMDRLQCKVRTVVENKEELAQFVTCPDLERVSVEPDPGTKQLDEWLKAKISEIQQNQSSAVTCLDELMDVDELGTAEFDEVICSCSRNGNGSLVSLLKYFNRAMVLNDEIGPKSTIKYLNKHLKGTDTATATLIMQFKELSKQVLV